MTHPQTLSALVLSLCAFIPSGAPDPTYTARDIRGWRVLVDQRLLSSRAETCNRALEVLDHALFEIERHVPGAAVSKLRQVSIWLGVEDRNGRYPCACYHPSKSWLSEHGYDPEKARSVDILNAETFVRWTLEQPSMVLHELSHAYHHQVLGYDHKGLVQAFENAQANGAYDEVLRYSGKRERAYALNNVQEYFAEASEAYFGTNDFYPFVRAELEQHDPELYGLMAELWAPE